jgi:hypothetical protein
MALSKSQQAHQRLAGINHEYEAKHRAAHAAFNMVFNRVMKKHGLELSTNAQGVANMLDVNSFPAAFHQDPELVAARAAHLTRINQIHSGRHNAARNAGFGGVRFVRTAKEVQ